MEILNPRYNTKAIESIRPERKMSAREGIIKTIIDEYIGFRQKEKGPCVINLPGLKSFKKDIAEYIQKIIPNPSQTNPKSLI
jgi:hypothetical protein